MRSKFFSLQFQPLMAPPPVNKAVAPNLKPNTRSSPTKSAGATGEDPLLLVGVDPQLAMPQGDTNGAGADGSSLATPSAAVTSDAVANGNGKREWNRLILFSPLPNQEKNFYVRTK